MTAAPLAPAQLEQLRSLTTCVESFPAEKFSRKNKEFHS
jgi:hypothetical protein